jgi:hypothetical protein
VYPSRRDCAGFLSLNHYRFRRAAHFANIRPLVFALALSSPGIEGRPDSIFEENDYAVCEDRRVGRIYFAIHVRGPEKWAWFLNTERGEIKAATQTSG